MVKCSECGFLAVRDIDTRELEEVDGTFREWGRPPLKRIGGRNQYKGQYDIPLCFVQSYNLYDEVKTAGGKPELDYVIVKSIIDQDRQCNSFIKWQQGFTPKEHREMIDREAMRKWQAEREESGRKWMTHQQRFMVIIAGIFTILGGIIGAVITFLLNR